MSKQGERRAKSHHKTRYPAKKTGSKKDQLPAGYKPHENTAKAIASVFIPKFA
jgi:hypothetical protein